MYFERPFKIDGVFFAIIDGEKIEISREVAKAMLSFYRKELYRQKQWAYVEEEEKQDDSNDSTGKKKEAEIQAEIDKEFSDMADLIDELKSEEAEAEADETEECDSEKAEAEVDLEIEKEEKKEDTPDKKKKKRFKPSEVLETVLSGMDKGFSMAFFADQKVNVENEAVQEVVNGDLKKSYNILTAEERWLVDYIFFNGMSHADASKLLGISRPAVTKRVQKILKKMKKDLEEKGYDSY